MGVGVILGLFEFLKKIPTDGGGVTLMEIINLWGLNLILR